MKTVSDQDIKFLLKDVRAERPTLINLVFRYNNGRFKTSTGLTIEPYLWDSERQRAFTNQKSRIAREPFETLNANLERYRSALKTVLSRLQLAKVAFSNDIIKQQLDSELGRIKKPKVEPVKIEEETFTAYIERFVGLAQAGLRLNARSARYSEFTLKGYIKLKRLLEQFQAETGNSVNYEAFSLEFYHAFKLWLTSRGLTLNYVGSLMKDLKVMLKQAYADGVLAPY
ncbi:hypothetical protein GCM10028807_60330 [Spirosoma daeguense]